MSTKSRQVVLVTGASGFLGQHIVKLLHERDDNVTEIRAFDTKPFRNTLGFEETKRFESIVGDIRNSEALIKACRGVDCVIHSAAFIDFGSEPDLESMRQVNVKGTENVIKACKECGVATLIFTSTVDVVVGNENLVYVRESQAKIPDHFLMGPYAETKLKAENIVLEADGQLIGTEGGVFRTIVLRPVVMYGEGDPYFVTSTLRNTVKIGGTLVRLGSGQSFIQPAYVGNVAWAHIVAKNQLNRHAESVAGRTYFITDDTIPCNAFDFVEPYIVGRGFAVSQRRVPYWAAWYTLKVLTYVHFVGSYFCKVPKVTPIGQLTYVCKTYVVNRMCATYRLQYSPIYTPSEAHFKSMNYYKSLQL